MGEERRENAYRVCLLGACPDGGNMGCAALTTSLIHLILDSKPEAEIYLLYGRPSPGTLTLDVSKKRIKVRVVNHRLSPKARFREHLLCIFILACIYRLIPIARIRRRICRCIPCIATLVNANFVGQIHGGDSFSDLYGLRRFIIGAAEDIIAIFLGKELVLLPQTFGPYRSMLARALARFILGRSARVYARDRKGIEVVHELLGRNRRNKVTLFCPDVAFALEPVMPKEVQIEPPLSPEGGSPLIGLNVSGLLYRGGYTRDNMFDLKCDYKEFVQALVQRIMSETEAHILLVPHVIGPGVEGELDVATEVLESVEAPFKGRVHRVSYPYYQHEIKGIIGLCDFFIGSRMHACIAALSQGIPSACVAYSRKFQGVFKSIGIGHMVVDARRHTVDTLLTECMNRLHSQNDVAAHLTKVLPAIKSELSTCFKSLLLDTPPDRILEFTLEREGALRYGQKD